MKSNGPSTAAVNALRIAANYINDWEDWDEGTEGLSNQLESVSGEIERLQAENERLTELLQRIGEYVTKPDPLCTKETLCLIINNECKRALSCPTSYEVGIIAGPGHLVQGRDSRNPADIQWAKDNGFWFPEPKNKG